MPLLLQALPLSLKTFWRYLLVLPILGIIALLLSLGSGIPVLGYFVPGTVAAYCVMVGMRCALAARGHASDQEFWQLLRAGLVFSLLTSAAVFVVENLSVYISAGILMLVRAHDLGGEGWAGLLIWLGSGIGLSILLLSIWGAAIAVPMTAAVADSTDRGTGINLLHGFGSGVISLALISLAWMSLGNFFAIFGEIWTMFALLATTIVAVLQAEDPIWDWSVSPFSLLGSTLFMTWASSWFYSAAVLFWERDGARREANLAAKRTASRATATDLRALRAARLQRDDSNPSG